MRCYFPYLASEQQISGSLLCIGLIKPHTATDCMLITFNSLCSCIHSSSLLVRSLTGRLMRSTRCWLTRGATPPPSRTNSSSPWWTTTKGRTSSSRWARRRSRMRASLRQFAQIPVRATQMGATVCGNLQAEYIKEGEGGVINGTMKTQGDWRSLSPHLPPCFKTFHLLF